MLSFALASGLIMEDASSRSAAADASMSKPRTTARRNQSFTRATVSPEWGRRLGGKIAARGVRKHDAYRLRLPGGERVAGRHNLDLPYLTSPQAWIDSLCARIQRVGDGAFPPTLATIPACRDVEVVLQPR